MAATKSGRSIPIYIEGAPVSVMDAGWCSVFHQSTLNLIIGRLTTPTKARMAPGAKSSLGIVESPNQGHVAEIQEEQHEDGSKTGVPYPPCAPHRLPPQAAGDEAYRGEASANGPDLGGRQVGKRVPPDQRSERAQCQRKIAGRRQPCTRDVDIHDPDGVALLPVSRRKEETPCQPDRCEDRSRACQPRQELSGQTQEPPRVCKPMQRAAPHSVIGPWLPIGDCRSRFHA